MSAGQTNNAMIIFSVQWFSFDQNQWLATTESPFVLCHLYGISNTVYIQCIHSLFCHLVELCTDVVP